MAILVVPLHPPVKLKPATHVLYAAVIAAILEHAGRLGSGGQVTKRGDKTVHVTICVNKLLCEPQLSTNFHVLDCEFTHPFVVTILVCG